jgi:Zn finger protein HypA/HybF involved in hydrogenase expression
MSNATIKHWKAVEARNAKQNRPSTFLGCTCEHCKLTWIVCELPQPIKRITTLTSAHQQCPNCGAKDPRVATVAAVRALLTSEE